MAGNDVREGEEGVGKERVGEGAVTPWSISRTWKVKAERLQQLIAHALQGVARETVVRQPPGALSDQRMAKGNLRVEMKVTGKCFLFLIANSPAHPTHLLDCFHSYYNKEVLEEIERCYDNKMWTWTMKIDEQ
jgi:hypothetical protein